MKKTAFLFACFFIAYSLHAQQNVDLEEKIPYPHNDLEFGYYITNQKSKEVKGDDMDRYEVVLFVRNKSNSVHVIPFPGTENVEDELPIAEFSCKNATGQRLTSKNGKVKAKPWFAQVRLAEDSPSSKYKFVRAQIGYAIKGGETLTNKIIVIVPKGERPVFTCRAVDYPQP